MTIAAAHLGMVGTAESTGRAPAELAALERATEWLNSPRLTAASLLGKVVVVDFCTYTCINWLRTLPYIRAWADRYKQGLVVIGVHTPEFVFEQNLDNVRRAMEQLKISHPIVIDNNYAIWRSFSNQYWPALYFIDASGRNRQQHFGEGDYERSEKTIQSLLAEAGVPASRDERDEIVSVQGTGVEAQADWDNLRSPENYVGSGRTRNFSSPGGAVSGPHAYALPARLARNQWALAGDWTIGRQATVSSRAGGRLVCRFHARDVHLVMGPSKGAGPVRFRVSIDWQPPGSAHGLDVDADGNGTAVEQRLYQLVRQPTAIVDRTVAIDFLDGGVETYAFTFG
jgi:Thioredoxin like C-terminal domain